MASVTTDMVTINSLNISLEEACLIGIKHYQKKELAEAVKVFKLVTAADQFHPRALNALAVIDSEIGNYAQAHFWLDILLNVHPDFEKAYNTRGMLLLKLRKVDDAEKDFLKAISLNQNFAEAFGNLGNIHFKRGRYKLAAECFTKIVSLNPLNIQAYCSLGNVLAMQGFNDEAETNFSRALDIDPDFAAARLAPGDLLLKQGRFAEAIAVYLAAVHLKPEDAVYHRSLGNAYRESGKLPQALECLLVALSLDESDSRTHLDLGNIYWDMGRLHDAAQAYKRGLIQATLPDDIAFLHCGLGAVFLFLGQIDESLAEYRSGLAIDPGNPQLHSNLLMAMHYSAKVSTEEIFSESMAWCSNCLPEQISTRIKANTFPLKIGFVSADFCVHSVSCFFEPLLAALDRKRFKVYCYSNVRNPDTTTIRLKSLTDRWVDCFNIPDDLLAEQICAEQIDILVDLSGHTKGNRLGVFARRAAPIQITWLGYPDTTGLGTIDYRISDAIADPVGVADQLHTEKLIRIADCFLCYLPPGEIKLGLCAPAVKNTYVTFGTFNNLAKITSQVLEVWAKILKAVPSSRLVLKNLSFSDDIIRKHWSTLLKAYDIDHNRVNLIPFEKSKFSHFSLYGGIDIALDTFPYNGTTTTCEALWMGVPVITITGDRHSSRVGASLLSCVGLNELVAESPEEYITKAITLAGNIERLDSYRRSLRKQLLASPLCDSASFARRWEDAVLKAAAEHDAAFLTLQSA